MIVRELAARLGLDVDAASFAEGGAAVELVKAGLEKLLDVAGEMVTKFKETVLGVAEAGDQIKELSQSSGVGAESLQRLANAAKTEGVGIDGLAQSLTMLTRMMASAKAGSAETAGAFKKAGVSIVDASGKLRGADQVFVDLAEAFSKMPDGAEKTALAFKVLGRNGPEMIKVLNLGREEIESLGKAGLVLTEEQIEAGDELIKTNRKLGAVTSGIWKTAIAPLLPAITDLVKQYTAWRKANAEVVKSSIKGFLSGLITLFRTVGSVASTTAKVVGTAIDVIRGQWQAALLIMGAALGPFIVSLTAAGVTAIATAAGVAASWIIAAAPFIAIAAAISTILLLLDDLQGYKDGKDSVFGRYKKLIDAWMEPADHDPWWLTAIKSLVRYMEKALDLAGELDLNGQFKGTQREASGAITQTNAKGQRVIVGGNPLALPRGAETDSTELSIPARIDRFLGRGAFAPSATIPIVSGTSGTTVTNNIQVTQLPGEDGEHFAQRVAAIADERHAVRNEEAAAALPSTQ